MLTRLTGARVYDPANGVRGEVRDIWVEDTHICTTPPHPSAAARTIDLSGKVLMAGAIDIHSHIAGGNVNTARVLMPEQHVAATRRYGKLAFSGAKWSAFDTGYRYAEMVDTIGAADGMPMHLAHIQFYGYGGEGERGFSLPPITRTAPHLRPTRSCSAC